MDPAGFDRLTRLVASRRGVLQGLGAALLATLGQRGLGSPAAAAKCRALGRPCTRQLECCSKTCSRPDGPTGRPVGRKRCLCHTTLQLPCGGRCCGRNQTCKRGRCVHHCKDGRISGDESDRDCGGDDCPKCEILQMCDRPSDCASGRCARIAAFNEAHTRCVECITDSDCGNPAKPRCNTFDDGPGFGGVCTECVIDAHCPVQRRFCSDTGECAQCLDELHCQPRELCEGGTCVRECTVDVDCPGQICQNGSCVTPDCEDDAECPVDRICQNGECGLCAIPFAECKIDAGFGPCCLRPTYQCVLLSDLPGCDDGGTLRACLPRDEPICPLF